MSRPGAPWLAVVDYGAGNLASLGGALDRIGARWRLADGPDGLEGAAAIVLPGVGAAAPAMRALASAGLDRALVEAEAPLLGICLGMQLLCERSSEGETVAGLGLVPGTVGPLPAGVQRPHMGWNRTVSADRPRRAPVDPARLAGWFYFAHSYAVSCDDENVLARVEVGGAELPAAIGRGRAWGVQFHPERSARAGLALLASFWSRIVEETA